MEVSRISTPSIQLSEAGIANMKFQLLSYKKSQAGEALAEAEQAVIDRMKAQSVDPAMAESLNQGAAAIRLSKLGLEKAEDLTNLSEMDGVLEPIDNLEFGVYRGSVSEKTGYAAEFDLISRGYADLLFRHQYEDAANMDVLAAMQDKHKALQNYIQSNYTGDEREEQLKQLDADYQLVLQDNIIKPIDMRLKNEKVIHELQTKFADLEIKSLKNRGLSTKAAEENRQRIRANGLRIGSLEKMTGTLRELFADFGKENADVGQAGELFQSVTLMFKEIHASNHGVELVNLADASNYTWTEKFNNVLMSDAVASRFEKQEGTSSGSFERYADKMALTYDIMKESIEAKYADPNHKTEYYIETDGRLEKLTKEKELELLDKAYENQSRLMAVSTEIWADLKEHSVNSNENLMDAAKQAKASASPDKFPKGGLADKVFKAFMSAIRISNRELLGQTDGMLNGVFLNLDISEKDRRFTNEIWDYMAANRMQ